MYFGDVIKGIFYIFVKIVNVLKYKFSMFGNLC